jgi:hypothetical protein
MAIDPVALALCALQLILLWRCCSLIDQTLPRLQRILSFATVKPNDAAPPPACAMETSGPPHGWQFRPLASEAEDDIIRRTEPDATPLRRLKLLRHLRALGPEMTPVQLAARLEVVDAFKRANLNRRNEPRCTAEHWPAANEIEHGAWASEYIEIGLRCGRALGGHHVKIERVGVAQTKRMERETGAAGEERLFRFYLAMIENMQAALDEESLGVGRLLGTYEIFDVGGMRISQVSLTTLRFARRMMTAFSNIYTETTAKVAIINLPWAIKLPLSTVLEVLHPRVKRKISILGADWERVLAAEVDEEAMRLLRAPAEVLWRHQGARGTF